nr:Gag-Pol polyprotein [Tanacetum cinerariifolium]
MKTQTSNTLHNAIMEAGSKDRPPMLAPGCPITTTARIRETYKNVSQEIRDQLNTEAEAVQIILTEIDNDIYSTVDACPNAKFTSQDGESLESYYSRFYKIMNELIRNQCKVTNHQVNVQFLLQLQPEWQRETVGSSVVQKSAIQCYNCKEFGHVARECQKPKRAKDTAYHREKMLLCKQEEAGIQLNAEQADWRDDTDDDELEDQELEAHYIEEIDQNDDDNDIAKEHEFLASLIEKLKCEIDESKNRSKFLETSNKVLMEKLKGCYNDNLALMLTPNFDEVIRLKKESRSKLSDLIRPFDYTKLNNLYDSFVPPREKSSEQRYFSERSRLSHINVNNGKSKESFNKQSTLLEKRMDESIPLDKQFDACPNAYEMWKAIERLKQGESINVQDLETNLYWEFRKFTSQDGESLESYYSRFYMMMNELIRNQCKSQELKTVSYHKLYDILKQNQHEVNEIRAKKIARVANPLVLVAQQQPVYHPQTHPTNYTQNSSTRSHQTATRNRGKAIVNSPQPIYDQETSMVADEDESSKDKEIDKLMALISLLFKKIYKPTNNNLRTSSNTSRANQDNSPRVNRNAGYKNQRFGNVAGARETVGSTMVQKSEVQCYNCKEFVHISRECQKPKRAKDAAYHREKMLLCKQEKAGIQLNAEQADWRDDTDDDELEDQELVAHYMYMAQLQEVSPDVVDSGPIF